METAEPEEGLQFLDESVPVLDDQEMEDLYRHFLEDEFPEEDDADEDFEPSLLDLDEEEEDEEAGVRRRNIQARELDDLLQDAYKQLGPSVVSPGLKERVLDQLSMHFQLLAQTSILAVQASPNQRDRVYNSALGMLEHLTFRSSDAARQGRRTRARWKTTSTCWDPEGEDLPAVGVPGLFPGSTLSDNIKAARENLSEGNDIQQVVEGFMTPRGGVIWPQLLPTNVREGTDWPLLKRRQTPGCAQNDTQTSDLGEDRREGLTLADPSAFSMVEDRLLCRGIHLHGMEWDTIKDDFLPHKSMQALMQRYAILSGWASLQTTTRGKPGQQVGTALWTPEEDLKLKNAVQKYGKKWTLIARDVLPSRGKEGLRSRWAMLESRMPTEDDRPRSGSNTATGNTGTAPNTSVTKAYGTTENSCAGNSGDAHAGAPILYSRAQGSTLSAPLSGLPLVPRAFGTLDSATAGHPLMLGAHGLWPPLGINPLDMRVPPLPVLPSANIVGPVLVGGNPAYHTPHPLVAIPSGPATASAGMIKRGAGVAHRPPATDMAMMGTYGTAGAGLDGPFNPSVSRFFSSAAAGYPVPSRACKRSTGATNCRDPGGRDSCGSSHTAAEGQTIAEMENRALNDPKDLADRLEDPGAVGGDWSGSQSNAGIYLSEAPSEVADRMAYAEDELSDDGSDGSAVAQRNGECPLRVEEERPRGSSTSVDKIRVDFNAEGAAPPQKLYEEDELSDDADSNPF